MPRGYNDYSFVIDSSFRPFTMQEMLTPFLMYKDAYEKAEEQYVDLSNKADKFKYLAENLDPNSKARQIYEGYANDLKAQADDFANGLNMQNRSALTNLRRRYQGEIGRLVDADAALQQEKQLRRQLSTKDPSMLYGTENLDIDMYLDGKTPNLYNISGDYLYTKGAQLGRSISSRIFNEGEDGSVLGGLYKNWKTTQGVGEADIANFLTQPNVQEAIHNELKAVGVTDNLKGNSLDRATRNYMQGLYEGIVYQEKSNPMRDPRVLTPKEAAEERRAEAAFRMNAQDWADRRKLLYEFDDKGNVIGYKDGGTPTGYERDPATGKLVKTAGGSGKSSSGSSSGSRGAGSNKLTQSSERLKISWKGNNPNDTNGDADEDYEVSTIDKDETSHVGKLINYEKLPTYARNKADEIIGDGDADLYQFYFKPYESGGIWNDTEAELEIVPRDIKDFKQPETLDPSIFGSH